MRPAASNSTANQSGGFWHWSSPIPYLFGGLALMLGIITVALVILACSYRKSLSNRDDEKSGVKNLEILVDSDEPKIVVIMAGDHNPTFLAKPKPKFEPETLPVVCNCHKTEQV